MAVVPGVPRSNRFGSTRMANFPTQVKALPALPEHGSISIFSHIEIPWRKPVIAMQPVEIDGKSDPMFQFSIETELTQGFFGGCAALGVETEILFELRLSGSSLNPAQHWKLYGSNGLIHVPHRACIIRFSPNFVEGDPDFLAQVTLILHSIGAVILRTLCGTSALAELQFKV